MTTQTQLLWYIPNQVLAGHRGDTVVEDHNSLASLTEQALALEEYGWQGALLGTSWGRPDTWTVATALAARTTRFEPLVAIRPGYWQPVHFASAAATLDHLTGGRLRINIVSGQDALAAYGDRELDQAQRYGRTKEFMRLVRRLWTQESVDLDGQFYQVSGSSVQPPIVARAGRAHPKLYFGGASAAAEQVAATEADVQLFWGEPLADVAERIDRLKRLSETFDRDAPPLEFGLRVTTVVRESSEAAWAAAHAKIEAMRTAVGQARRFDERSQTAAVGQQRLHDLRARGEVLDQNLFTLPGTLGGTGAGTTWLVGSAQEVAQSLQAYQALGVTHFVLSDTPYLQEIQRQGQHLLPLLRAAL